jgi:hypothetical protein
LGPVLVHPESQGIQQESFQDKLLEILFGFLFLFTLKARESNRKAFKTNFWKFCLGFCSSSPESHDIQEGKLSRQTLENCVWVLFLFTLKAMTSNKESSQDKLWEIGFEFVFIFSLKARASNRKAVKTKLSQSSFKTLLRGVYLSRSPKEIENERLHMKPDWQERQRLDKSTNSRQGSIPSLRKRLLAQQYRPKSCW